MKGEKSSSAAKTIKAEAVGKMKPLVVKIREGGRVVQVIEIPDPRESWCREFNRAVGPN